MSIPHQLTLVKGTGAGKDIFTPRKLGYRTQLLFGEAGVVELYPVIRAEVVLAHDGAHDTLVDGGLDSSAEQELPRLMKKFLISVKLRDNAFSLVPQLSAEEFYFDRVKCPGRDVVPASLFRVLR